MPDIFPAVMWTFAVIGMLITPFFILGLMEEFGGRSKPSSEEPARPVPQTDAQAKVEHARVAAGYHRLLQDLFASTEQADSRPEEQP